LNSPRNGPEDATESGGEKEHIRDVLK
jgi:hypothetical protein